MSTDNAPKHLVAVIGAGPAGLFAARQLALEGVQVALLNRDIKPGGLAEYGIYPSKYKMKAGLRKQFRQILDIPGLEYYGNVLVGQQGDLTLDDLRELGFQALMITAGAQGTKWLGLPGEELPCGVYHAKDLVYHYNKLPPFSQKTFHIGKRVALIGVGNVMLDIARYVIRQLQVDEVIAVARRGPAEVKFDKKEMEYVGANLDVPALDEELERVRPVMEAVGQDVQAARDFILAGLPKSLPAVSESKFRFDFLASPTRIIGDEHGNVTGLEVEETKLIPHNGDTKARGTGVHRTLNVDTVIFCIGDRVDEQFGLPVKWNEFIKNPNPAYPMGGVSYEAYDLDKNQPVESVFVAGWSREASSGLVGVARKDGETGAKAVLQYLNTLPKLPDAAARLQEFQARVNSLGKPIITKQAVARLFEAEENEAARQGLEEFKFSTNEEMLAAIGDRVP